MGRGKVEGVGGDGGGGCPNLLYVELEHKMGSKLLLYLHQYFSISLSSNVSSDQMKDISFQKSLKHSD